MIVYVAILFCFKNYDFNQIVITMWKFAININHAVIKINNAFKNI